MHYSTEQHHLLASQEPGITEIKHPGAADTVNMHPARFFNKSRKLLASWGVEGGGGGGGIHQECPHIELTAHLSLQRSQIPCVSLADLDQQRMYERRIRRAREDIRRVYDAQGIVLVSLPRVPTYVADTSCSDLDPLLI